MLDVVLLYIGDIGELYVSTNMLFWRRFLRLARCLLTCSNAPWGAGSISCRDCQAFLGGDVSGGEVSGEGITMSMLDQDTSTMRMRLEATPIELRRPEIGPQSKARGIYVGVLLGAMAWLLIIALVLALWGLL